MGWQTKPWMCDGFQAVRPDGEKVFVYRRLAWEPAHYEQSADTYEFRWHGIAAGRLTSENTWRRKLRLIFTLDTAGAISEQDLLEISMQIMGRKP